MMFKSPTDRVIIIALVLVAVAIMAIMAVVAWVSPPRHHQRPQVAILPPIESPLNQPDERTTLGEPQIEDNRPDVAEAQTTPEDAIDPYADHGFVQPGPPIVQAPPDSAIVRGNPGGDRGVGDKPSRVFHHKARKHKSHRKACASAAVLNAR